MPGMAPMAAAMMGIKAGRIPPRIVRLVVVVVVVLLGRRPTVRVVVVVVRLRRQVVPEPASGTALAVAPVNRSVAVAGRPEAAAALAASAAIPLGGAFALRQAEKFPRCSR